MKTVQLASLYFACLLGIIPCAAFARPYVISPDGTEVTDKKTGLIWRRCAEGMSWNGKTCTGDATTFINEKAKKFALEVARTSGTAWRLPILDELSSIIDPSRANPAIDPKAFPGTPATFFWTISPEVFNENYAWYIDFANGVVHLDYDRKLPYAVRLVRSIHD